MKIKIGYRKILCPIFIDLRCIHSISIFIHICVPWGFNPRFFFVLHTTLPTELYNLTADQSLKRSTSLSVSAYSIYFYRNCISWMSGTVLSLMPGTIGRRYVKLVKERGGRTMWTYPMLWSRGFKNTLHRLQTP